MNHISPIDKLKYKLFGIIPDKPEFRAYLNKLHADKESRQDKELLSLAIHQTTFR
jgi:hypothetical protein